ncbi:Endoribonuclease Dicer-like 3 [Symbiodinium microadriaticum]|uniref:Endoribonuclease Dicer-like 3 n=1 Tax=Symbiodinium microadriaticum TaxID=2951 RepID=A0A1Q9F1S6_SYMMI|nr:Endoribonuclease Dicer-like 3 [Symbiodinium microadriaticum]
MHLSSASSTSVSKLKVRDIKVADVTGGTIPATRERWTQLLDTHQVVVATGQLAKQAIAEWCYLSLEQLSLLILDECHHAVGGNPIASLMQGMYMRIFRVLEKKTGHV